MLCRDALMPGESSDMFNSDSLQYIGAINLEVISKIQKELETYDLVSLVFLLYDVPDTALQRLIVLLRVSKDIDGNHLNLLYDWALHTQAIPTWRQQFLEALAVCQLHSVIRKLGFHVPTIKARFSTNKPSSYINPMKKALYQLCENMSSSTFENFKRALHSYEMNVMQYDRCELVLLQLMCQKFITLNHFNHEKQEMVSKCKIEQLLKIMDRDTELKQYSMILREIGNKINRTTETPSTRVHAPHSGSNIKINDDSTASKNVEFNEIFNMLEELHIDDIPIELMSDRESFNKINVRRAGNDMYPIKNMDRVGICCIINQEVFHPSKDSIECGSNEPLDRRHGSSRDKILLEKTMRSLNFDIITKENISRKEMIAFIKEVVQKRVSKDDSIFMLCILSHGIRGHVYAADSVAVKVDYIQSLLDDALLLRGLPKVLILQACQIEGDVVPGLAADSPRYNLRKTDFLVYWATSPELEAYRSPELGSLFIQTLCGTMKDNAKNEHLFDLFTRVTDKVSSLCTLRKCDQVPIFKSTLRKKLFLHLPSL